MQKIALVGKYGNGKFALIDNEDYAKVMEYRWYVTYEGYVYASVNKKPIALARFLLDDPKGYIVDHIDNNKLNNQRYNLRICTVYENALNQPKHRKSKSGFMGVTERKDTRNKKWMAIITKKGKRYTIGYFATKEEAARARDQKAKELFGEHAVLNFV